MRRLIKTAVITCVGFVAVVLFTQNRADYMTDTVRANTQATADAAATERDKATADQAAATARIRAKLAERQQEIAASAAASAARDAAWSQYYKRTKECESPVSEQAFIACGNKAIEARRSFDRTYQPAP